MASKRKIGTWTGILSGLGVVGTAWSIFSNLEPFLGFAKLLTWVSVWWGYLAAHVLAPIFSILNVQLQAFDVLITLATMFVSIFLASCIRRLPLGEHRAEFVFGFTASQRLQPLLPYLIVIIIYCSTFFVYYEAITYPFREVPAQTDLNAMIGSYDMRVRTIERFNAQTSFSPNQLGPDGSIGLTTEFFIAEVGYLNLRTQLSAIIFWFTVTVSLPLVFMKPWLFRFYVDSTVLAARSWTVLSAIAVLVLINVAALLYEAHLQPLLLRLPN